jgi:NAD(P)-dependent dehydrogenase (short-subunit alcohol dehydrogenase family)
MSVNVPEAVVVVTGASSGIGRATALAFARQGAAVVAAARRGETLHEIEAECAAVGGRCLGVAADVTDFASIQSVARRAVDEFGRIDVWVNNAAVSLFARFEEAPLSDFRQVLETNVFGYIHGARAALPILREQGHGTLINVASVVSDLPQPYTSAYVMSKHAVRALGMCLRQELALDDAENIHVCTVLPASIDTPLFQQAGNYTRRNVQPMSPVYPAEHVANAIVSLTRHPRREVTVGAAGQLARWQMKVLPGLTERLAAMLVERSHLGSMPVPPSAGNLYQPSPDPGAISGGWRSSPDGAVPNAALVGALALPAFLLWRRARERTVHSGRSAALHAGRVGS